MCDVARRLACDVGCVNFYSHFLELRLRNYNAAQYWFSRLVAVTAFLFHHHLFTCFYRY